MENTQLIGLSKQMVLERQMDVIANNLANVRTSGFKGESLLFEEYLMPVAKVETDVYRDRPLHYVYDVRLYRHFKEGSITLTGNPLDVAINGKGWFAIQRNGEEFYTRDGSFTLDSQGQITTAGGLPVQSDSGPIVVEPGENEITISADGTVSTERGQKGKLRIVAFDNEATLEKVGDNLFRAKQPPLATDQIRIMQGAVEGSNVEPVAEITNMIRVTRAYILTSRMLENASNLERKAIEDLGQIDA